MMDTTLMFAALVLIAAMGLLLYQACLLLERRLLRGHACVASSDPASPNPASSGPASRANP